MSFRTLNLFELGDENDSYGILVTMAEFKQVEEMVKHLQTTFDDYNTDDLVERLETEGFASAMIQPDWIDF